MSNDQPQNREMLTREIAQLFHDLNATHKKSTTAAWMNLHLTLPQFKMLVVISHFEASTLNQIAEQLGIGEPAASYLVDRLVQTKLVERTENPEDRRRVSIRASTEGKALLDRLIGPRNWLEGPLGDLDLGELEALRRGLKAVVASMKSKASNGK